MAPSRRSGTRACACGAGELVALVGANGAGKTTLLRAISGLMKIASGTISLHGERINGLRAGDIVRRGVAHCPEERKLWPMLTVAENLSLGAYTRRDKAGIAADVDRVHALFPQLAERGSQLAGTLSGGEQQMVAIGRALMSRPRFLLLDEPSLGLAPIVIESLVAAIKEINRTGTAVLLVEQNASLALGMACARVRPGGRRGGARGDRQRAAVRSQRASRLPRQAGDPADSRVGAACHLERTQSNDACAASGKPDHRHLNRNECQFVPSLTPPGGNA